MLVRTKVARVFLVVCGILNAVYMAGPLMHPMARTIRRPRCCSGRSIIVKLLA